MVEVDICGLPISFPNKPYMTQMSMMSRIVNSLNNRQNCLLELPTGSGKTAALLCSTLAWLANDKKKNLSKYTSSKPTKIYFGTRTHKQIGQVVRELKKSAYANVRMTILSGRKQTCVVKEVLNSQNIEQGCRDMCSRKEGCYYKVNDSFPTQGIWDIESMKPILINKHICPFYQFKSWMVNADIIFCPYNYLLNPFIRKSMNIDLQDAIVILDEAHNIEDICREAFSLSISQAELNDCKIQFHIFLNHHSANIDYKDLGLLINDLDKLIQFLSKKLLIRNEDVLKSTWDSKEFILLMKNFNLKPDDIEKYKELLNALSERDRENRQRKKDDDSSKVDSESMPSISPNYIQMLEVFLMIAALLFDENKDCRKDFSFVITEGEKYMSKDVNELKEVKRNSGIWFTAQKRKSEKLKTNFILNLWCMNPGLVFQQIAKVSHSIILTSGTLSPMSSFQKELDCKFESVLEAHHIVSTDQTFMASIGCGPTGVEMQAVYRNTEKTSFKDELGRMILNCCEIVPNGILCFLSSFSLMESLLTRWTETKLINEFEKHKSIFAEPRNTTDMDECMKSYYENIETGALLFAVYRGKASEGMDFADDAARLVITVGIPYPSISDPRILLKKNYNTIRKQEMKEDNNQYLNGNEWYNIQAFRALNQAIGRCIRHRSDWGAMIMIDSRFGGYNSAQSSSFLCKWIRDRQHHFNNWNDLYFNLNLFMSKHIQSKLMEIQ